MKEDVDAGLIPAGLSTDPRNVMAPKGVPSMSRGAGPETDLDRWSSATMTLNGRPPQESPFMRVGIGRHDGVVIARRSTRNDHAPRGNVTHRRPKRIPIGSHWLAIRSSQAKQSFFAGVKGSNAALRLAVTPVRAAGFPID
jgi:hypothetical protein